MACFSFTCLTAGATFSLSITGGCAAAGAAVVAITRQLESGPTRHHHRWDETDSRHALGVVSAGCVSMRSACPRPRWKIEPPSSFAEMRARSSPTAPRHSARSPVFPLENVFHLFPGTDFSGPEKIGTGAPGSYGIVIVWIWEFRVEFHLFMGPNVTEYKYSCQRN